MGYLNIKFSFALFFDENDGEASYQIHFAHFLFRKWCWDALSNSFYSFSFPIMMLRRLIKLILLLFFSENDVETPYQTHFTPFLFRKWCWGALSHSFRSFSFAEMMLRRLFKLILLLFFCGNDGETPYQTHFAPFLFRKWWWDALSNSFCSFSFTKMMLKNKISFHREGTGHGHPLLTIWSKKN